MKKKQLTRAALFAALNLMLILFLSCGYKRITHNPSIFSKNNISKLTIEKINNPTRYTFLTNRVRSIVMDEFSKKIPSITWVDEKKADAKLLIDIVDYFQDAALENPNETTVKTNLCITMRFYLNNIEDKVLFDSKNIKKCESIDPNDSDAKIKKSNVKIIEDCVKSFLLSLQLRF